MASRESSGCMRVRTSVRTYAVRAVQMLRVRMVRTWGSGRVSAKHFTEQGRIDARELFEAVRHLTDYEWLELLRRGIRRPYYRGIKLPGLPPEEIQVASVGSAGAHTLGEAFNFYTAVKRYAAQYGEGLGEHRVILDFGCGWGRTLRFFLKEVASDNLHGVDVDPEFLDMCQQYAIYGTYDKVSPVPPTKFKPDSVDLVYAYSVFSHLSEPVHLEWIQEFARILKRGGLLIVTTQGRHFLDFCASLHGKKTFEHPWHRQLASSFGDTKAAKMAYDQGVFLHSPTGGGAFLPVTFYGETLIPPIYVTRVWTRYLRFKAFLDDRWLFPQAIVVMQKE